MPRKKTVTTDIASRRILDLFLSGKDQAVADAFAELDPLTAAAVSLRVAFELDAPEVAEFLEGIESFEIVPDSAPKRSDR